MKLKLNDWPKKIGMVFIGAFFYALGISLFLDPHGIAPGGLTGIAIVINQFIHFDTGLTALLLNIPLLIIGRIRFGKEFLFSTVFTTVLSSLFISGISYFTSRYSIFSSDDLMLSALAGGILLGIGMGIIFRQGATTGGTDIIIRLGRARFPFLSSGVLSNAIDACIIAMAAVALKNVEIALYSLLASGVNAYVLNLVLYGSDNARLLYVVSDKPDEIAQRILHELEIGVTYMYGEGGYTAKSKKVIMCVVKRRGFPDVKRIVREEDPEAFLIVSSANEIYGEGYKENNNIEL